MSQKSESINYAKLLTHVKHRIGRAQVRAALSANVELIHLYWDIGKLIESRQQREGWGSRVIPRLSHDIRGELPEIKGFSERNIKRMLRFYREYPEWVPQPVAPLTGDTSIVPQAVAPLGRLLVSVPWSHHVILMEKLADVAIRQWYMMRTAAEGWGRDTLAAMIGRDLHAREGNAVTNFGNSLPEAQSELAGQLIKDPYIFDFMTLEESFHERELETGLVHHLEKFLLELGQGFAFVGRQYPLSVGDQEYYVDLLFYHFHLHCFVVVELKRGAFKPEYAGKMNFYCSVVDDLLRSEADQLTIGLILCQTKNRVIAEYALRDVNKPIGISNYDLARALPQELRSSLPTIEEIEAELSPEVRT